ncbi:CPBP family intramembrane glutamic endopeptidase [Nigerium massiliense]|uniref:CPBP family intramembrane glutamic endopeptidase n=1 Tax=Nigerium massiliense TaxID=1522317 RepID=UPI000693B848|nr:CPBP family intramembrane glutamic endopeptidase [Nigerium massiliense]
MSQQSTTPTRPATRTGWRGVLVYCVLAYGLAWLVCLPLWLDGRGLANPLAMPLAVVMMFTPAVSALIVNRFVERRSWRTLGIGASRPVGRFLGYLVLALVGMMLLVAAAMVTSALLGQYAIDPGLSALRALLEAQLAPAGLSVESVGIPMGGWVAIVLAQTALGGLINTVPAFGEELGWRGYLFPRLNELAGPVWAVLGSGIIWGLWHAPLILLGYNYPSNPVLGLGAMCVVGTVVGAFLAFLRQRSSSVWPAALGHGTMNAAVGTFALVFSRAGASAETLDATIMGWSGWPIPVLLTLVLLRRHAFVPRTPRESPTSA